MRFFVGFMLTLVLPLGGAGAEPIALSTRFSADLEASWQTVRLAQAERTQLVGEIQALFEIEMPPRFPGVAEWLLKDAELLESNESLDAAHDASRIACVVDECGARVRWRLIQHALSNGGGLDMLEHISGLVVGLSGLFQLIGGPLGGSESLSVALILGAVLFGVLVTLRHAYLFGVSMSARIPLVSAYALTLVPVLVIGYGLSAGLAILAPFFGVLLVLPFVSSREAVMSCACVGMFWAMSSAPSVVSEEGVIHLNPAHLLYYSTSAQQRAAANPALETGLVERQMVDDLRFSRSEAVLKRLSRIRVDYPELLLSARGAGLVNLEGIGHAVRGEHEAAVDLFKKAFELAPGRFEPLYNQIKLLKSVNRDEEAQPLLGAALALDAAEMGARVAADFAYSRDLEGFALFSNIPWWRRADGAFYWAGIIQGVGAVKWVFESKVRPNHAGPLFGILCVVFLLIRVFHRQTQLYLPCSSCGEGALQTQTVYEGGGLDCDLCRLDVSSAAKLERGDLHRHALRVSFWTVLNRLCEFLGTWIYPGLRLLQTRAPMRAFLFGALLIWFSLGAFLSQSEAAGFAWGFGTNLSLLFLTWFCGVLVVRQREVL